MEDGKLVSCAICFVCIFPQDNLRCCCWCCGWTCANWKLNVHGLFEGMLDDNFFPVPILKQFYLTCYQNKDAIKIISRI